MLYEKVFVIILAAWDSSVIVEEYCGFNPCYDSSFYHRVLAIEHKF